MDLSYRFDGNSMNSEVALSNGNLTITS